MDAFDTVTLVFAAGVVFGAGQLACLGHGWLSLGLILIAAMLAWHALGRRCWE